MARYVVTSPVQVAFLNYLQPGRAHKKGDVVELSAAEVSTIGAGSLRAVDASHMHDMLGEAFAVANGS
jgi:hypothetical protein